MKTRSVLSILASGVLFTSTVLGAEYNLCAVRVSDSGSHIRYDCNGKEADSPAGQPLTFEPQQGGPEVHVGANGKLRLTVTEDMKKDLGIAGVHGCTIVFSLLEIEFTDGSKQEVREIRLDDSVKTHEFDIDKHDGEIASIRITGNTETPIVMAGVRPSVTFTWLPAAQ